MATENFEKAAEIFQNAIEIEDPAERERYLENTFKTDPQLRTEVEALLKAHEKAGGFLDAPGVTLDASPSIEGPGTRIGRYELLQLIGEGGMGLVYLAEQKEPVRRKVALKIIKPGMDSKQVVARFEAERQVLALLDHPNIARVLDAGTTETGRPYFVMEYVKGLSITQYCDANKLNIEQRLKLFRQVCEGVHHAHQKGIIHRDLKPSNILVSMHGDRAVPKIIDFGIAKATTQPLTDKTVFTYQGQLLGTPEYMSPEQVDLAMQDIDIRSDIYSLGVVLYELLAGVLPFEREFLARLGFAEVQQTIREQEPASPSVRLTNLGEQASTIAASRGTQAVPLARRLHRELEWIPLKAMRKDRCRRYRSAAELADDVQNYLDGNPLTAGPETAIYRVKKFVRRHAGSVATVALVAAAIILGLVASTAMYWRSERSLQREATARNEAEQQRNAADHAKQQAQEAQVTAEDQRQKAEKNWQVTRRLLYCSDINRAGAALADGGIGTTLRLLEACPGDLRGWEWHYLWNALGSTGKTYPLVAAPDAISPDYKHIASKRDTGVIIYNTETGAEKEILGDFAMAPSLYCLSFNPDGSKIAIGYPDGKVKVWDTATGMCNTTITVCHGRIRSVAFSPDGKHILSGFSNGLTISDATTGDEVMKIADNLLEIKSVGYSLNGENVVAVTGRSVKVWNVAAGATRKPFEVNGSHPEGALNADGSLVAISTGYRIEIFDTITSEKLHEFPAESYAPVMAFDRQSKCILWGGSQGRVKVGNLMSGTEEFSISQGAFSVAFVAFGQNDREIVAVSSLDVGIWSFPKTGGLKPTILGDHRAFARGFSADMKQVVTVDESGLWIHDTADAGTGRKLADSAYLYRVTFSPSGKRIATYDFVNNTIKIWDCENASEICHFETTARLNVLTAFAFSADDKYLASGDHDGVLVWDIAKRRKILMLHKGPMLAIAALAFSPDRDGKRLVLAASDNGLHKLLLWQADTGAEKLEIDTEESVNALVFSPNGRQIASGSLFGRVETWDAESGKKISQGQMQESVSGISYSPDGTRIVSWGGATIDISDANTGAEILALHIEGQSTKYACFSPDGKRLLAGCVDGTVRIWDSGDWKETPSVNYWRARGLAHYRRHGYSLAASAFSEAIDIDPCDSGSYLGRAAAYARAGNLDEAMSDFNKGMNLDPENPGVLRTMLALNEAYAVAGDHDEAKRIYGQMLRTLALTEQIRLPEAKSLPDFYDKMGDYSHKKGALLVLLQTCDSKEIRIDALNALAWMSATSPAADVRDGTEAVQYATQACTLTDWAQPAYIDTLAAAYAEAGDFTSAVKWQKKAMDLLKGPASSRTDYESRLRLYESGKPYREAKP